MRDARIDKPFTSEGISDPVVVFTDNGIVEVAYWDERDRYWHDSNGETFGNVQYWDEINFPHDWHYDDSLYGGED